VRSAWDTATIARMTEVSLVYRRRAFAIAAEVRRLTGQREAFALAWTDEAHVVARKRVGRRFDYLGFPMTGDDGAVIAAIVEWVER
jgi:hypothetical protein